jgi:hypothetical protein
MPTIDIPDKICPHCGGIKWYYDPKKNRHICSKRIADWNTNWRHRTIETFREKRRLYYHTKVDKALHYERSRKRAISNPEREREYKRKYSRSEKAKLKKKEYVLLHPEQTRLGKLRAKEKAKLTLSNSYVKQAVVRYSPDVKIKVGDIPQELIEIKREQLLLTRKLGLWQRKK